MRALSLLASALLLLLAFAWALGSNGDVERWSGVMLLGGWALVALAPAFLARAWPGALAATGLLTLGLGADHVALAALLLAPWAVLRIGHAWQRLQTYVGTGGDV